MDINEVQRVDERRGHAFLPPTELAAQIPKLYATERVEPEDKVVWLHYFTGSADWYITEVDHGDWTAFGYANLGDPTNAEWGYIDLLELGSIYRPGTRRIVIVNQREQVMFTPHLVVERDLHWTPCPFGEVRR